MYDNSHMGVSRREFLLLMGASGAAFACGSTSLVGYWLLADSPPSPPSVVAERSNTIKTIERPVIVNREEWGARAINHEAAEEIGFYSLENPEGWREYTEDLRAAYQTVVIHHSSLYDTDDWQTMHAIQDLHMDNRGWADIGYHFCIGLSGTVFEGRQMSARGTHTELYNTGSLGVCLLGNFEEIEPTQPQLDSTQALVNWLALRLQLTHLAGHREFNGITVCPGANLYPHLDQIAAIAGLQRGIDGYVPPEEQRITPIPTDAVTYRDCCM